jgi:2-amino-4-hydroxy-6-hydroxymethyldihydropteridine diphosphokinase
MILVALGSNLAGPWGDPRRTVERALKALDSGALRMQCASSLMETPPLGPQNQPAYVNAVAHVRTHAPPDALLSILHAIEKQAGRRRGRRWGPRTLDLDIVDYHGLVRAQPALELPHPGIAARAFVLRPIAEIAPGWRHPLLHLTAAQMLQRLG